MASSGSTVAALGAGRHDQTRRDQGIGGLEGADQRQAHAMPLAVMLDDEVLSEAVEFGRDEPQGLSVAPDRDELEPPRLRYRRHAPPGFAIDIDDRGRRLQAEAR